MLDGTKKKQYRGDFAILLEVKEDHKEDGLIMRQKWQKLMPIKEKSPY